MRPGGFGTVFYYAKGRRNKYSQGIKKIQTLKHVMMAWYCLRTVCLLPIMCIPPPPQIKLVDKFQEIHNPY